MDRRRVQRGLRINEPVILAATRGEIPSQRLHDVRKVTEDESMGDGDLGADDFRHGGAILREEEVKHHAKAQGSQKEKN